MELVCWNCGESVADVPLPISRHANCRHCFEVLHCCRMCELYNTDKPDHCDHDRTEPPVNKETANFCEYFKPTNRFEVGQKNEGVSGALDALFGDDAPAPDDTRERSTRSKLDDLFDD